jgi:large subunit ribosomal protein L18
MNKKESRIRRATRTRSRIRKQDVVRLCVSKTPRHIYAQVTLGDGSKTLVSASTVEKTLKKKLKITGNVEAAKMVGKILAERALKAGVESVAFDRSGYRYHGRIKALADAAREVGLKF